MGNIFRVASTWLKVAIICMGLGLLLFVIGFSTPVWKTYAPSRHVTIDRGLWQGTQCQGSRCTTATYSQTNDFHRAVQAMECIGFIGFALGTITLLLYMCADSARRRDFLQAATAFTFVGVVFAGIGFALASSSNRDNIYLAPSDIGWSMGLAIAGCILFAIAGTMLILQLIGC